MVFLKNLGAEGSHYFFKCLFIPALDIFSLCDFDNTNARFFFIIVSLVCEPLLIIPGYFLSVVQIGKFLLFCIQLYWSFFPPFCYWAIHWVFIVWLLYISILKFPFGLLRLSIYFWEIFVCLHQVFVAAVEMFYLGHFKLCVRLFKPLCHLSDNICWLSLFHSNCGFPGSWYNEWF